MIFKLYSDAAGKCADQINYLENLYKENVLAGEYRKSLFDIQHLLKLSCG